MDKIAKALCVDRQNFYTIQPGSAEDFMREWLLRQQELHAGVITKGEYFEWKVNWPQTCDDCGKCEPKFQWRKAQ